MRELEQELVTLGRALDVPEAPTSYRPCSAASIRVACVPAGVGSSSLWRSSPLAALLATLAIPDARSALLSLPADRRRAIELVDELPVVSPSPAELELMLGQRVSLDEARSGASFELLELDDEPDAVYLGDRGTVWFLYGRPDAVRLLVAQTPEHEIDEPFILKKLAASGTSIEARLRPRAACVLPERRAARRDAPRRVRRHVPGERPARAGRARVGENGRTVRLEGDLTRADALEIADSLD